MDAFCIGCEVTEIGGKRRPTLLIDEGSCSVHIFHLKEPNTIWHIVESPVPSGISSKSVLEGTKTLQFSPLPLNLHPKPLQISFNSMALKLKI